MFKNFLFLLFLLIFSTSCSSTDKTINAAIKDTTDSVSTNWLGTWERIIWQNDATLEIKAIKNNSITFSIIASSGGHTGEVEGDASVKNNTAIYLNTDEGDTCLITFTLLGDSIITIDQKKGFCFAGMGVEYSGRYKNKKRITKKLLSETLFDLEIFNSKEQDSIFENLVGGYYESFLNTTQLTTEAEDLDSLDARVKTSGIRGMYTYMENIIMITDSNVIWAAVIDDNTVYYFTNSAKYKNTLPKTINTWREAFKDYEVIYNKKAAKSLLLQHY